jgi:Flp pilus assembly pilin Flp
MVRRFHRLRRDEQGANAIEYAIIAALIGIGLIGSLVGTRGSLSAIFGVASSKMANSDAGTTATGPTSTSPRAPFWQAKTQTGTPIVSKQGAWTQTVYNYSDGTQVGYFTNSSATPPTRSVALISPDHLTITTTTLNANGATTYEIFQQFRQPVSFSGFSGLVNADPTGQGAAASSNPGPMIFPSSPTNPASYDQYTYWSNIDASGKPLNYTQDNYNTSGGWVSYSTGTPGQAYVDATTVGGQDVGYFSDITK